MLEWNLYWWEITILGLYFGLLLFIFFYSLTQLNLVWKYSRSRQEDAKTPEAPEEWPMVTVQLPIFNEKYVAKRLIDCVAVLDYPQDKLQIQVLDDSTDETLEISRKAARHWQEMGLDIEVVNRTDRSGFKAGALAYGLNQAKGDYIAIFDADFVPDPAFLKKTVPHFQDEKVGVVQTRWEHLNSDYSTLTTLQAFGLDAHFTVEQGGRNAAGFFINFNGTAGIWRKETIEDAGGWSSDTLTEDLDLSYRAQLRGWQFVFREDIGSPAELPAAINALKTQQFRWTKGAAECTMKNLGKVWRAKGLSLDTKIHALFHLMNSFIFICVMGTALLSVPMLFIKEKIGQDSLILAAGSLFLFSLGFLIAFYWVAFRAMNPGKGFFGFLGKFFLFLSVSMGLSLHNAIAVVEGYIGRKTPFIRTPKFNIVEKRGGWKGNVYLGHSLNAMTLMELSLAGYFAFAIWQGIRFQDFGLMPFHILLCAGFAFVGWLSVKQAFVR